MYSFFMDGTQRWLVLTCVSLQPLGIHMQGSNSQKKNLTLEDGTDSLSWNVGNWLPLNAE